MLPACPVVTGASFEPHVRPRIYAVTSTCCNSGHLASGGWFDLSELSGNMHAGLYDGTMHEWTLNKQPVDAMKRD